MRCLLDHVYRDCPDTSQWLRWWKLFQIQYLIWKVRYCFLNPNLACLSLFYSIQSSPDVFLIHDELVEVGVVLFILSYYLMFSFFVLQLHMGHPCDHHFDGIAVFIEEVGT